MKLIFRWFVVHLSSLVVYYRLTCWPKCDSWVHGRSFSNQFLGFWKRCQRWLFPCTRCLLFLWVFLCQLSPEFICITVSFFCLEVASLCSSNFNFFSCFGYSFTLDINLLFSIKSSSITFIWLLSSNFHLLLYFTFFLVSLSISLAKLLLSTYNF